MSPAHAAAGAIRVHATQNQLGVNRVGIALPKMSRAIDRNRARRRIHAIVRPLMAAADDGDGVDVVVTARSAVIAASFADLSADLTRALVAAVVKTRAPTETRPA